MLTSVKNNSKQNNLIEQLIVLFSAIGGPFSPYTVLVTRGSVWPIGIAGHLRIRDVFVENRREFISKAKFVKPNIDTTLNEHLDHYANRTE